jgi:hypothetical protein
LIVLALDEERSGLKRGGLYHLPLRQDLKYGHPADIVVIDEGWNKKDIEDWDNGNRAKQV